MMKKHDNYDTIKCNLIICADSKKKQSFNVLLKFFLPSSSFTCWWSGYSACIGNYYFSSVVFYSTLEHTINYNHLVSRQLHQCKNYSEYRKIFSFKTQFGKKILQSIYDWIFYRSDKPRKALWGFIYDTMCTLYPNKTWRVRENTKISQ